MTMKGTKKCATPNCKRRANQQGWKTEEEKQYCLSCWSLEALLKQLRAVNYMEMEIKLDGSKMLKEIFELDGTIHKKIREQVESRLVEKIVNEIEDTYFKNSFRGTTDDIQESVLEEIKEKQEQVVKKILRDFYDSYRFGKKDIMILKKLKDLLGEDH